MRIPGSRTAVGNYRLRRNIVGRGNCEPPPPHSRCFRGSRTPAKKVSGELGGVGGGEGRRGCGPGGSVNGSGGAQLPMDEVRRSRWCPRVRGLDSASGGPNRRWIAASGLSPTTVSGGSPSSTLEGERNWIRDVFGRIVLRPLVPLLSQNTFRCARGVSTLIDERGDGGEGG